MSQCTISPETIEETIRFHGHSCPGLALGIRASELALSRMDRAPDEEVVAVVETDMCAVDALQYLTGCTFGKGNLIHLDYGKNAFTFYRRPDGEGIRVLTRPEVFVESDEQQVMLKRKKLKEGLSPEEEKLLTAGRKARIGRIMDASLEDLFEVQPARVPLPRRARILESLTCGSCGEKVMETRTRRFSGQTLCIPCFTELERRL